MRRGLLDLLATKTVRRYQDRRYHPTKSCSLSNAIDIGVVVKAPQALAGLRRARCLQAHRAWGDALVPE